ncbi:hypothetical protein Hanom_Chr11g01023031 [Helianthus anomalus]
MCIDYAHQPYDQNWAHFGTMVQVVERRRPPTFSDWPDSSQMLFDHQTYKGQMYASEEEINNHYINDRNRRMHNAWHTGQPVVAEPPIVDYSTLPPYDDSVSYPTPPLHHSMWVDPR